MALLTFEEGTYVDCTIKSDAATTANTSNSGRLQKSGSRTESAIWKYTRASRDSRFIPFLDVPLTGDGDNSHHILVRLTSSWTETDGGFVTETTNVSTRPANATWNKFDGSADWTTPGGRDDVKPYSTYTGNLVAGSSGNYRGLPLGRHQAVSMLLNDETNILITPRLTLNITFRLEEVGTGSLRPDLVIKGRYATRNRENPIRSRRFGVR